MSEIVKIREIKRKIGLDEILIGTDEPSLEERLKLKMMTFLLILLVILGASITALLLYYFLGNSLKLFKETFPNLNEKEIIEKFIVFRKQRLEEVKSLFQTVISSILVPLITLFLGYIFGKHSE